MSASQRPTTEGNSRLPRLQPSPSLPNLRARNRAAELQQTRPQPTPHKPSSQIPSTSPVDSLHSKEGNLQTKRPRQQSKNQHYLTPPLTPASSLRSDSTGPDSTELSGLGEERVVPSCSSASGDAATSRFLIIGNVLNDLSEDVISPYFHSLAAPTDEPPSDSSRPSATGDVIQSIYYRFQDKRAIILSFYDSRDADRVKRLIETKGSHGSEGKEKQKMSYDCPAEGQWTAALTCLFVAPNHFVQLLGPSASAVLTRNEGAFGISVGAAMAERDQSSSSWSRTRFFVPVKLKSVLAKYGELKLFHLLEEDEQKCVQLFMIEYYDVRAGEMAWEYLDGRVVDSMKLRLIQRDVLQGGCNEPPRDLEKEETVGLEGHHGGGHAAEPKTPTASTYLSQSQTISTSSGVPFPLLNDAGGCDYPRPCDRERPNGANLDTGSSENGRNLAIPEHQLSSSRYPVDNTVSVPDEAFHDQLPIPGGAFASASDKFGRRGSNSLFFDAVHPRVPYKLADTGYVRNANMNANGVDRSQVSPIGVAHVAGGATDLYTPPYPSAQPHFVHDYFNHADRYAVDPSMQAPWVSSPLAHGTMQYPVSSQSPVPPLGPSMCWDGSNYGWFAWGAPGILPEQWSAFPSSAGYYHGTASQAVPYPYPPQPSPPVTHHPFSSIPHRIYPTGYPASPRAPPESNQLDIRKIEQGLDTRTTVMIKNIPNKMTDKELIAYINKVCPRRIDFLYLRMDFQNGCNVGYAFVNFIAVGDLMRFAKTALGEKWNMYSSEKVLQMSYANYQGKEALVEKFKNSCIMDEREEWRPKIFFSEPGPKQGLPEEFPKPTHMRRKERSSYNRGALFVPGITGASGYHKTFLNASPTQRGVRSSVALQGDQRQSRKLSYPTLAHNETDV